MKTTIISIILSVFITFVITENYMLSNMQISGATGNYTVSVFGAEFDYNQQEWYSRGSNPRLAFTQQGNKKQTKEGRFYEEMVINLQY